MRKAWLPISSAVSIRQVTPHWNTATQWHGSTCQAKKVDMSRTHSPIPKELCACSFQIRVFQPGISSPSTHLPTGGRTHRSLDRPLATARDILGRSSPRWPRGVVHRRGGAWPSRGGDHLAFVSRCRECPGFVPVRVNVRQDRGRAFSLLDESSTRGDLLPSIYHQPSTASRR